MPKLSPSNTIPSRDVRMIVRPAGAVPSTGAPQASYPAGTYDFETHILIIGADPIINRGAFPGRLSETIRELVPGATSAAASNAIVKGSATTVRLPAPILVKLLRAVFVVGATITAADIAAVFGTTSGNIPTAVASALIAAVAAGSSAYSRTEDFGTLPVTGHWVTITGRLGATSTWTTASLNRAIARAFANNVTWQNIIPAFGRDALNPFPAPNDGNPLFAALNDSDACTGGSDYSKVYAAACTRVGVATTTTAIGPSSPGTSAYMKPTTQGTVDYTKTASTTSPVRHAPTQQPTPTTRTEASIQTLPPVSQPPAQRSKTGTYVAVGAGVVAVGLLWWQRESIFG